MKQFKYKVYTTVGIIETDDWNDISKYVLHREDGPAVITYRADGSIWGEEWYINGVRHREDGPALIWYYNDGSIWQEEWRINGVVHREDGPAFIRYHNDRSIWYEAWWWCGMYHRHDYTKAARIYADGRCDYYWYGVCCARKQLLDKNFRDRIQLEGLG